MIRRPPRSTLFPTRRSSDLKWGKVRLEIVRKAKGQRGFAVVPWRWIVERTFAISDRKSTRLNSSHLVISYAVFCLKKKTNDLPLDRSRLDVGSTISPNDDDL